MLGELSEQLATQTSYSLQLETLEIGGPKTAAAKQVYDASGRMEINLALAEVDTAFADQQHRPHKKSKQRDADGGEVFELAFISPEVGTRHQEPIAGLEARTRWRVRLAPRVDQQAVLRVVQQLLPDRLSHQTHQRRANTRSLP